MAQTLLAEGEVDPFETVNPLGESDVCLVCEHAGRTVPKALGRLGLDEPEFDRHIAFDIGAEGVARKLSALLDAPLVIQPYSRLVYDCNRPPDAPSAMPDVSETTAIPGNRNLTPDQRLARTREIYRPFHEGLADLLDRRAAERMASIVVSIHSFTPVFKGKPRKVELGILHDRDTRLSSKLIKSFPNIEARLNEPYGPKDGVMHTLNLHAAPRGLQHAMIEIRNDLIATDRGQDEWAQRLSVPLIQAATR